MAELAFDVKANYDEVIRLREELERLREEMLRTGDATEEGKEQMQKLEEQYAETSDKLNGLVEKAAESAAEMGNNYSLGLSKSSAEYKMMTDALRGAEDGVKSFMREKQKSGELDDDTAKKLRILIYALQGLQTVLKTLATAQQSSTAAKRSETAATTAGNTATKQSASASKAAAEAKKKEQKAYIEATAAERAARVDAEKTVTVEERKKKATEVLAEQERVQKAIMERLNAEKRASVVATTSQTVAENSATVATTGLSAAEGVATGTTLGLAASVRTLSAAMSANPIGLAMSLIPLATSLISGAGDATDATASEVKGLNKELKEELDNLDNLFEIIENTSSRTNAHRDAVEQVNEMCKEYNVTLLNENDTLEQQKIKYEQLAVAIRNANAAKIGEKYIAAEEEKAEKKNDSSLFWLKSWVGKTGKNLSDDTWAQISLRTQGRIEKLAQLSGAAYESERDAIVKEIEDSIRANTNIGKVDMAAIVVPAINRYVKKLDQTQRNLDQRKKEIISTTEEFKKGAKPVEIALEDATFDQLEAAMGAQADGMGGLTIEVKNLGEKATEEALATKMAEKAVQGTTRELKDRKSRLQKRIEEMEEGSEEQTRLKGIVKSIGEVLKSRNDDGSTGGGGGGRSKDDDWQKQEEREAKAYNRYQSQITKLIQQIEGNIKKTEIQAMEDRNAAALEQLDLEKEQLVAKANEIALEMEELDENDSRLPKMKKEYDDLIELINRYIKAREGRLRDDWAKEETSAMNEYLKQYGTYEERRLAITKTYEEKISKARTEGEKLSLARKRDVELNRLKQSYDDNYRLIFSRANTLSDNLLAKAIEATQRAIKDAKDSGDIQALTELYARLREQMGEQNERNSGWGWNAISEGFDLRASAEKKRADADSLKEMVKRGEMLIAHMNKSGLDPKRIDVYRRKYEEMREEVERLEEEANSDEEGGIAAIARGVEDVADAFSSLGPAMASFANGKGGAWDTIADIGKGLDSIAKKAGVVKKALTGDMKKEDAWSTIFSGTVELVSMVGQAIVRNKEAQEDWNRAVEETEHRYRMLQLDKLDYKQSNIFGVEDPFKRATMGADQYRAAMEDIAEVTEKLSGGKVKTGTKKEVDWGNVGKGLGTGAGVGAALGMILGPGGAVAGAAIGSAIGAGIGAIAGALSTKVVPVFESLQDHYGYIFDPDTFELNDRIIADYQILDDKTKEIVDHWDEIKKKAEEARNQLKDNLKDYAGDLGKQLEDTLVNAWKDHRLYSAVDDYTKYVGQQIASILQQQAFSSVFQSLFDDLGKKMEESFLGPNADNSIIDDLDDFNQKFPQYLDAYGQLMDQLDSQMQDMGYDGFRDRQSNADATTKSFQQISETTGSAIQGGVTALRLSSEVRNQHLSVITGNLSEMLLQQLREITLAEDIRGIQADAYLALLAIRDNTAGNLRAVQNIEGLVDRIEKNTREL